jgi:hypothetical protein
MIERGISIFNLKTAVDFNAEEQICIASIGKMKKIILDDGKRKIEN